MRLTGSYMGSDEDLEFVYDIADAHYNDKEFVRNCGFTWDRLRKCWYTTNIYAATNIYQSVEGITADESLPEEFWSYIQNIPKSRLKYDQPELFQYSGTLLERPERPYFSYQRAGIRWALEREGSIQADDMGCITGDALIPVNRAHRGFKITVKELYKKFNGLRGKWDPTIKTMARSLKDDEFGLNEIQAVIYKGVQQTIKLTLENGYSLTLTPEHPVLTDSGYVEAGKLIVGSEIVCNGVAECLHCKEIKEVASSKYAKFPGWCRQCINRFGRDNQARYGGVRKGKFIDKDGYYRVNSQYGHPRANKAHQVYEHILVMEAHLGHYIEWPMQVHHKDGNKSNNAIENLELVTPTEHHIEHRKHKNLHGGRDRVVFLPHNSKVVSIEAGPETEVYDISMAAPYHNFVANGIVVHNCGKTLQGIGIINNDSSLNKESKILIICPSQLKINWERELALGLAKPFTFQKIYKSKGQWVFPDTNIVIINFDMCPRMRQHLAAIEWDLIIIDEAHTLRNSNTARAKSIFGMPSQRGAKGKEKEMRKRHAEVAADALVGFTYLYESKREPLKELLGKHLQYPFTHWLADGLYYSERNVIRAVNDKGLLALFDPIDIEAVQEFLTNLLETNPERETQLKDLLEAIAEAVEFREQVENLQPLSAKRRVLLTGTPITNRPKELYALLKFVDPNFMSRTMFERRFCNAKVTSFGVDANGASNLDVLQDLLRSRYMIRRMKTEVLDQLPPKMRQVIELPVDMIPGARELLEAERQAEEEYETAKAEYEAAKSGLDTIKSKSEANESNYAEGEEALAAKVNTLRAAIRVAFERMAKVRHDTATVKAPFVADYVADILESDPERKIILFAHHTDVIEVFMQRFAGNVVKVVGGMSDTAKQAAVDKFMQDPETRLFVGNIQAAGTGLTLTISDMVIFAELSWVPAEILQCEDRSSRYGQKKTTWVQHLVLESSLDAKMARTLVQKMDVINNALDRDHRADGQEAKAKYVPFNNRPAELVVVKPESAAPVVSVIVEQELTEFDEKRRAAILEALQIIAGMCDSARKLDGAGFSKVDAAFGKSLASSARLTPKQAIWGQKLVRKYKRQVPDYLLALAGITETVEQSA